MEACSVANYTIAAFETKEVPVSFVSIKFLFAARKSYGSKLQNQESNLKETDL